MLCESIGCENNKCVLINIEWRKAFICLSCVLSVKISILRLGISGVSFFRADYLLSPVGAKHNLLSRESLEREIGV